tara:strand:- start:7543 stop:10269 length:2727 start_codon:yes stop_codon:yes gene_type:complete
MNDFGSIINFFQNEDVLFKDLINVHFHKLDEKKYAKINLSGLYPLINRIIQKHNEDLILVLPGKKEVAYLSSLFAALTFYKKDFQKRLENFNSWLTPGINVMLCSSGKETGKIYKYLGKKNEKFISLGSLVDDSVKIDHKIETLLQLAPVTENELNKQKIGKNGFIPNPNKAEIDEILNIKSYDNPMLYQNKIIVLTNFYSSYLNFLEKEILLSNINQSNSDKSLNEIIKTGQIDEMGNIKDHSIEPLIVYTRDLGSLYEYSLKTDLKKTIISDDIKRLNENFPIVQQIKDSNKNFNYLIFAEESEFEQVYQFKKKGNAEVWKFTENEIKEFIKDVKYDEFDLNKSYPGRAYIKSKNHIYKKDIYLETEDNVFNKLSKKFKEVFAKIKDKDDSQRTNIIELIRGLFFKMYELRDHIFGFPEDLKENTKVQINQYFKTLKTMESYLENEIFDDLTEIGNFFTNLPFDSNEIFKNRLNELYENIKLREQDSKGNYAILAYSLSRKNYYLENIKKKWGFDVEVIYSIDTSRTFKNLIIPSELAGSRINKILLNDNFENVYFIGNKSLKEEMNLIKSKLHNRWINLNINNEKKCEITNIDKKYHSSFFSPDQIKHQISETQIKNQFDFESHFQSDDLKKYVDDNSLEETLKVPAFLVIFNGDSYAFFTENFSVEVFNSVFDPSAYEKKNKVLKKSYKDISYGDIILLRHRTDRDVLDQESILLLNNDKEKFLKIKDDTMQISRIINKCISNPVMRDPFKEFLKEFKYDKGINNIYSLAKLDDGIICPNDPLDLKKIFKTCEKMSETFNSIVGNFKFDEKEINRIFNSAKLFKSIHLSAGFSISKKLKAAVRSSKNLEFDGNPLRVDIVNGEVIFGSSDTGIPEGYIVQVNNYEEGRLLKEHNVSSTNRLLFL